MFAATKACRAALPSLILFVSSSGDLSSARTHQSAKAPSQSTPNNWSRVRCLQHIREIRASFLPRSLNKCVSPRFAYSAGVRRSIHRAAAPAPRQQLRREEPSVDVVFGLRRRSTVLAGSPVSGEPTTMGFWPRARLVVRRLSTMPAFTSVLLEERLGNAAAAGAAELDLDLLRALAVRDSRLVDTSCEVSPSETGDLQGSCP